MPYVCEICDTVFDEPVDRSEIFSHDGEFYEHYSHSVCPVCASTRFKRAETCLCGNFMGRGDNLCPQCKESLRERFKAFCEDLSFSELNELNDMLDGLPLQEALRW